MTVRIVRDSEVRDALRDESDRAKSREYAHEQLAALNEWLTFSEGKRKMYGGDQYVRELLSELGCALVDWPEPLTAADLEERPS